MCDILQQNLKNPALVPVRSSKRVDSNSSEVLDLSCKHTTQSPETTNTERLSDEMRQWMSSWKLPMNFHKKDDTTKYGNPKLSQKKKQFHTDDPLICLLNTHINDDKVHNSQIHCNETEVDQIVHTPLKKSQIDKNDTTANQTPPLFKPITFKDINSNISYRNNILPILHQPSISIGQQNLPTNSAPMTNTHHPQTTLSWETETSTMLTSIANSPRPFKAYPKDPLILSTGNQDNCEAYKTFRNNVLQQIKQTEKEGTNPKMRRTSNSSSSPMNNDDHEKNLAYYEKRRKNNLAAKRSRDARRAKEDEIAIRAAFLEQENIELKKMLQKAAEKMWEKNIQFDFGSFIEINKDTLSSDTVHSSSSLGC